MYTSLKVNWKDAGKEFIKGAAIGAVDAGLAGVRYAKAIVTGASIAVDTIDYLWDCSNRGVEPSSEVIVWEVTSSVVDSVLGVGLEGGAEVANKTVDKIITTTAETGISIATDSVDKNIQKETEAKQGVSKPKSTVVTSNTNMPYLKSVYDPLIGKYREIVVYP